MTRWVVVGGGSAGSVVAARLSERPADEVVVVEAGADHGAPVDEGDGPLPLAPERFRSDPAHRRCGHAPEEYLRGHGLGGSSLVNGGVVTGPASPVGHRLPLEPPRAVGPVGSALLASDPAARQVRLVRDDGRRVTAADAYLRPVLSRPNLTVMTGAEVERVVVSGRRATGVVMVAGDTVRADRVVFCAGAIWTPAILLRSGIDTPGIGEGLEDHPAFTIALRLRPDVVEVSAPVIAVAADRADHQVMALERVAEAPDLGGLAVAIVSPSERGRVSLPDPDGPPVVDLPALGRDLDPLTDAVAGVVERLSLPAWRRIVADAFVDDRGTPVESVSGSRGALRGWLSDHAGGHFHAAATCREGVVCDGGAVRGYRGLYVADASALPALPRHDVYLHVVTRADHLAGTW